MNEAIYIIIIVLLLFAAVSFRLELNKERKKKESTKPIIQLSQFIMLDKHDLISGMMRNIKLSVSINVTTSILRNCFNCNIEFSTSDDIIHTKRIESDSFERLLYDLDEFLKELNGGEVV